jgi:hypothetical protein
MKLGSFYWIFISVLACPTRILICLALKRRNLICLLYNHHITVSAGSRETAKVRSWLEWGCWFRLPPHPALGACAVVGKCDWLNRLRLIYGPRISLTGTLLSCVKCCYWRQSCDYPALEVKHRSYSCSLKRKCSIVWYNHTIYLLGRIIQTLDHYQTKAGNSEQMGLVVLRCTNW